MHRRGRERQIHADNITTLPTPPSIHFFSEDTATITQRAKCPPRYKGTNYKTPPIQHADVGLIYHSCLISVFQHKSHEDSAHRVGLLALSYTRFLSPFLLCTHFETKTHRSRPELASTTPAPHCRHQTETDTREDTDRHLSTTTDVDWYSPVHQDHICKSLKPLPVLFWAALPVKLVDMKTKHSSYTLADAEPTDPIDGSQLHWSQHKTTDEDTADNTTKHTQAHFWFYVFPPTWNSAFPSRSFPHLFIFSSDFLTTCIPVKLSPFLSAIFSLIF